MGIQKKLPYVVILICAVALLYGQFLWNPIVFDDAPFFMVNASGHQPVDDFRYSPIELRSLPYATITWGKALFGLDMIHFRIENLLLHASVVVVLFMFLSRLFSSLWPPTNKRLSPNALAFSAALLFALHPVAVYAVGYLVQRTILMATLFSLLAMLSWMRGSERNNKIWVWGSLLFYYLAAFSKEHAIMLPGVLLALTVLLHEDWKDKIRSNWQVLVAMGCVALFVLFSKIGILGSVYEVGAPEMLAEVESDLSYSLSVLTQSALFFKYVSLWLFPNPGWLSVDMREPFAATIWSGYLGALAAYSAWGGVAIWLLLKRNQFGLLGFALLFPWLMFMPEFSTIRIQESFVLYRSYLWAVGACALIPLLLGRLDKHIAGVVVVAIALAMLPISMDRLASFSHPLTLWDDAAKLLSQEKPLPGSARIYNNRGLEYLKLQNYAEALQDFQLSIKLNSNQPSAYTNMGAVYLEVGQPQLAIEAFDAAIAIMQRAGKVTSANPFYGKAKAYEGMGAIAEARRYYEISCELGNKGCNK